MGIVPDLRSGEWVFSDKRPSHVSSIEARKNLTFEQENELSTLLENYFNNQPDEIGCAKGVEHIIETNSPPIKQRIRPISPPLQKVVNDELDKMLKSEIVEPSKSGWNSPILMVPCKEPGKYRFCIDYRRLNAVTIPDAYPLPIVTNTLDKLRDAVYLSTLDIKSAFWHIPVAKESRKYTAFSVLGRGHFQFKRLPFGLTNSPATWQRFADNIFGPELEPHVFIYLDDIIIVTKTFEEHLKILKEIFKRIRDAGLMLNKEKCKFCANELKYLGFVVNKEGLQVDPDKVKAIVDIPNPKSVKDVRRMVGMASWYRRFIPNFATMVAPLTGLLKKNAKFSWSTECNNAWTDMKNCLISSPILSCPDFNRPFVVQTDCSDYGIGGVLTQMFEDGEHVICYLSRSLNKCERRYSTTERELLALLWCIEKLRPYLEGTTFTAITDHHSLLWLQKLENPSGRLARTAIRLQQFKFNIIHRKGADHIVPDALSRLMDKEDCNDVPQVPMVTSINKSCNIDNNPGNCNNLSDDPWLKDLAKRITENPLKFPTYRLEGNRIFKFIRHPYPKLAGDAAQWRELVKKNDRSKLIKENHDSPTSGHLGIFKTYNRLTEKYYWPKMKSDVVRYINRCNICAKTKPEQKLPTGQMGTKSIANRPWESISVDIIGPLPRSTKGFTFILVVLDIFSKFVRTFPMRKANTANIINHLENDIFLIHGVPNNIITDNGVQFKSKAYENFLKDYNVKPAYVALYYAQANPVERTNRVIKTILTSYVSERQRDWDKYIHKVVCAINTAKSEVTQLTPYFINHGREMCTMGGLDLIDVDKEKITEKEKIKALKDRSKEFLKLYKDVHCRLKKAYVDAKKRYDLRHRPVEYKPGQLVWRKNFVLSDASKYFNAKLADKYVGPFKIFRRVANDIYELTDLEDKPIKGAWPSMHLKKAPDD